MSSFIIKIILRIFFRVKVTGLDNFAAAGNRVMVLANHASVLDALIIKLFLPGPLVYAIDKRAASRWWARPLVHMLDFFVIDGQSPSALKKIIGCLQQDRRILYFPEQRTTQTNSLMKVYQSTGMLLDKSDAVILPVYINGTQYSLFSKLGGLLKRRLFPKVTITILSPRKMALADELKGQDRRAASVEYLVALMREMQFQSIDSRQHLFETLLCSRQRYGGHRKIMEDHKREPLSYNQIILKSIVLGRCLEKETTVDQTIGIFMPTSIAATILIFALQLKGRIPAMLNYGAGKKALISCVKNAEIKRIYTSRTFVEQGELQDLLETLEDHAEVFFLEDLAEKISSFDKLSGWFLSCFPVWYYRSQRLDRNPDNVAVILFTSGSEGLPKGVALSHTNLVSNCHQVVSMVDFNFKDVLLNFLPIFHSFGLMAGTILPLVVGLRFFQYPSPLHYKIIPELAYEIGASILFATNTFYNGYAQQAHPYDFYRVRHAFAGAEPLTKQTEQLWMEKFGVRIMQGYGATETSPVLALNTPLTFRRGSVGHFVPGVVYKLIDVPGITEGKRLQVKGVNIMKGYLLPERPGEIIPPATEESGSGWYDTGDIVQIDDQGYINICGRAKRFAKIGGEMISLAAVEIMVARAMEDALHAVITLPDKSKGEQIILFTECEQANRKVLIKQSRADGLSDLHIPKVIHIIDALPVLASGKIDYVSLQHQAVSDSD